MKREALMPARQVRGEPILINGHRLSLSRAMRAGDFEYLTGQVPMKDGAVMTTGTIKDQTRVALDEITAPLALAGYTRDDVVKAMVWLVDRADFSGCNSVYGEYFPKEPSTRSTVVPDLLVDLKVEVEVSAYKPAARP